MVNFCEFDKYAEKSYCAIHGVSETLNLGDITKVNENKVPYFNMICGGSPCQDFSLAGKQAGSVWRCRDCGYEYNPLQVHYSKRDICEKCGSHNLDKTRSSLLVEWLRMIRGVRPDWGIYENVRNIVGKKFKDTTFKAFEEELHEYGYHTYWSILNAKHYGIPQNRERVYLILIKKELDNGKFEFPKPLDISVRLMDILEEKVEEKFYLPQEKVRKLIQNMEHRKALLFEPDEEQTKKLRKDLIFLGQIQEGGAWKNPQAGRVYSAEGCSPAINTCQGGNLQPKIVTLLRKLVLSGQEAPTMREIVSGMMAGMKDICGCVGFVQDRHTGFNVPNTLLKKDIRDVTAIPVQKIYAVISKSYTEQKYTIVEKLDKSIDLSYHSFSEEIESILERKQKL